MRMRLSWSFFSVFETEFQKANAKNDLKSKRTYPVGGHLKVFGN